MRQAAFTYSQYLDALQHAAGTKNTQPSGLHTFSFGFQLALEVLLCIQTPK
jgi:hypothetical protein